mgnify:CR=1 FL=1
MILFWTVYLLLSIAISFFISLFFENKNLKIFVFSLALAIFFSFWFRSPGENYVSPIISIFLIESTILDENGYLRILRPFLVFFTLIYVSAITIKKYFKT